MNTKPFFFLCLLFALFFIAAVAIEPSKDGTQAGAAEEPKTDPGLYSRGGGWSGGHGGGGWHGGGGHGGGWHGGGGGHGGGWHGGGGHGGGRH